MSKDILYLGSQSVSRKKLLEVAEITLKILDHKSDECIFDVDHGFNEYVLSIARDKMKHLILPDADNIFDSKKIFVLTADTLVQSIKNKEILGKPVDLEDAKGMLRILNQGPAKVVTGCCLERKIFINGNWLVDKKMHWTTDAIIEFYIKEESFDIYFKNIPLALKACSAGVVEGYGQCFLKNIQGSYTTVLGLPLFEVLKALKEMDFIF